MNRMTMNRIGRVRAIQNFDGIYSEQALERIKRRRGQRQE